MQSVCSIRALFRIFIDRRLTLALFRTQPPLSGLFQDVRRWKQRKRTLTHVAVHLMYLESRPRESPQIPPVPSEWRLFRWCLRELCPRATPLFIEMYRVLRAAGTELSVSAHAMMRQDATGCEEECSFAFLRGIQKTPWPPSPPPFNGMAAPCHIKWPLYWTPAHPTRQPQKPLLQGIPTYCFR